MIIFILQPIETKLEHQLWEQSTYKDKIIIREKDELSARQYVANFMEPQSEKDATTYISPWLDKNLVSCDELKGDLYNEQGQPGILHPESLRDA